MCEREYAEMKTKKRMCGEIAWIIMCTHANMASRVGSFGENMQSIALIIWSRFVCKMKLTSVRASERTSAVQSLFLWFPFFFPIHIEYYVCEMPCIFLNIRKLRHVRFVESSNILLCCCMVFFLVCSCELIPYSDAWRPEKMCKRFDCHSVTLIESQVSEG